jgi:hypothetical protein
MKLSECIFWDNVMAFYPGYTWGIQGVANFVYLRQICQIPGVDTVKKVSDIPVPRRDVTNQILPGRE